MDHRTDRNQMKSSTFDRLRNAVELFLPALAGFWITIAEIWNLPYRKEVVATIVAINILAGILVKVARVLYDNSDARFDGVLKIDQDNFVHDLYSSEFSTPLDKLPDQKEVVLKVQVKNNAA